jgi:hypothetical protein
MRPIIPHVTPLPSFAAANRPPVGKRPSRTIRFVSRVIAAFSGRATGGSRSPRA